MAASISGDDDDMREANVSVNERQAKAHHTGLLA